MPRTHDGREVGSDSAEWRLDCEARRLLQLAGYRCIDAQGRCRTISPRRHRQQYLARVQATRGPVERERLASLAVRQWIANPPSQPGEDTSR
ncbi:hypothetical protein R1G70_05250 [Stenotrophomonas sp. C960]|uniref:hypothetical protein n=1 Tax=Stenotrophomonas TaxID=40323 RepID=UPI000C1BD492|nr:MULTISPECIES: hypothetical protein [Stenotrophomonas]MBH1404210.1 hypothetical protein [Stenotrophomonas maltophilia]MBN4969699.1 hypothetical protein [Stenotrophomonas maltophilia]MBN5091262.1 hypothetical protein [Stenotrophomonas maltophilia]MCI1110873.1 hypothetical protein [Stenotrophomonas maltophilia]MDP9616688.1 hypothetical protein [Stenotrophomonas maltophilia]